MSAHVLDGLELHLNRLSSNALIADYYAGAPELSPFFAGYPWSADAFARRAEQVRRGYDADRRAALLSTIQPTTPAAAAKLERIARGDGFVVTTGQQAGLFGGPLYTTYKILTAVRLAQTLESILQTPVAPLFWVPADDHDWAEIDHVWVMDPRNTLVRVQLASDDDTPRSMSHRRVGAGIHDALEQLSGALPQNDFAAEHLNLLRECYRPDVTVAEAYRQLIARTYQDFDLLITSSATPELKRIAVPILSAELEHAEDHARRLRAQTDRLMAAGYHEQVAIAEDASNVMYEDENGRERLVRDDGGWLLRRTKRSFSHDELMSALQSEPERFSANVLLRPVVESYAFPTLAYVGGPAELSYFAQTGCLFAAHDVAMPLVFPRASADLVEAKVRKVLDKFGLAPADLRRPFHEIASQLARDELPDAVRAALHGLREGVTAGYAALVDAALPIDATLRGPLESARNMSHKHVEDAERKILSHLKKHNEIGLEQLRKAAVNLYPEGEPQERVLGTVTYLAKYGPAVLQGIASAIELQIDAEVAGWDGVRCA